MIEIKCKCCKMSLFTLGTLVKGINASAVTLATEPLGTSNTLDPVRSTGLHKGDETACTGVVFITWRRRTWRIFFISRAATLSSSASASYSSSSPSPFSSSNSTDLCLGWHSICGFLNITDGQVWPSLHAWTASASFLSSSGGLTFTYVRGIYADCCSWMKEIKYHNGREHNSASCHNQFNCSINEASCRMTTQLWWVTHWIPACWTSLPVIRQHSSRAITIDSEKCRLSRLISIN